MKPVRSRAPSKMPRACSTSWRATIPPIRSRRSAPVTSRSYTAAFDIDGLKGARIGLLTDFIGRDPIHADVNRVVDAAVARMTAMGATIVRVSIPDLDELTRGLNLMTWSSRPAFDRYLAGLGPIAPVKCLARVRGARRVRTSRCAAGSMPISRRRRTRIAGISADVSRGVKRYARR